MKKQQRSMFNRASQKAQVKDNVIYLYDEIGLWGITAEDFVNALDEIDDTEIHIHINSPGGSVWDGQAIAAAIKRQSAKTIVHVDGIAASIASIIALSADEILMSTGAYLMIHQPWSIVIGPADEMRKEADVLDKIGNTLAKQYASRSTFTEAEIIAALADETWLDADECVECGFADGLDESEAIAARHDLSMYNKVPDRLFASGEMSDKEIERLLRQAGMSRKEATAYASAGRTALKRQSDSGDGNARSGQSDSVDADDLAALNNLIETIQT